MIIDNVRVFQENKTFVPGTIVMENGRFCEREREGDEHMDGGACYAIPGLIDLHFHGCMGADFCDADTRAIARMAEYEASVGVTSICPASMTMAEEELHRIMRAAGAYHASSAEGDVSDGAHHASSAEGDVSCGAHHASSMPESDVSVAARCGGKTAVEYGKQCVSSRSRDGIRRARLVGINMEGPFISAARKGAQAEEHIRNCDVALFRTLQEESGGLIKLVDLAPEEPGAMSFIETLKDEVVLSLAHTVADYDTAMEAFARGASHVTHLYNAMPPLNHRNPGVVGAARDTQNCRVELICDGIHLHPSIVRATFAMFGADRIILISDSMRATGLSDGQYTLGGQAVSVCGSRATLADGTIAGSVTNLMSCLQTAVRDMGIPLTDAVSCATINPAKELGIYDSCGSITPGKVADLVLLDEELQVRAVFLEGMRIR